MEYRIINRFGKDIGDIIVNYIYFLDKIDHTDKIDNLVTAMQIYNRVGFLHFNIKDQCKRLNDIINHCKNVDLFEILEIGCSTYNKALYRSYMLKYRSEFNDRNCSTCNIELFAELNGIHTTNMCRLCEKRFNITAETVKM